MGSFTLTADYYIIEVDDRIAVSQDFNLTPAEVAALGLFLCSDAAANISGADMPIDGAWSVM